MLNQLSFSEAFGWEDGSGYDRTIGPAPIRSEPNGLDPGTDDPQAFPSSAPPGQGLSAFLSVEPGPGHRGDQDLRQPPEEREHYAVRRDHPRE